MILNKCNIEFKNIKDYSYDKENKRLFIIKINENNEIIINKWKGNNLISEVLKFNMLFLDLNSNLEKIFINYLKENFIFIGSSNGKFLLLDYYSKEIIKLNYFENVNSIKEIFIINNTIYLFNNLVNKIFLISVDNLIEHKKIKIEKFLNLPKQDIKEFKVLTNNIYFIVDNNLYSMNNIKVEKIIDNIDDYKMNLNEYNNNMIIFNNQGNIKILNENKIEIKSFKLENIFIKEIIYLNNIFLLILDDDDNIYIYNLIIKKIKYNFKILTSEIYYSDPFLFKLIDNYLLFKNIKKYKIIKKNDNTIEYDYLIDVIIYKNLFYSFEKYKLFDFDLQLINYNEIIKNFNINDRKIIINNYLYFCLINGIYMYNISSQKTNLIYKFENTNFIKKFKIFNNNFLLILVKNQLRDKNLLIYNLKNNKLEKTINNVKNFCIDINNKNLYYILNNEIYKSDNNFELNKFKFENNENKKIDLIDIFNDKLIIKQKNILKYINTDDLIIKVKYKDEIKINNNFLIIYNKNKIKIYNNKLKLFTKNFKWFKINNILIFDNFIIINLLNNQSYIFINNEFKIFLNHNSLTLINSILIPISLDKNLIILYNFKNNNFIINIRIQNNDNSLLFINNKINDNILENFIKILKINYFDYNFTKNKSILNYLLNKYYDNIHDINELYYLLIYLNQNKVFLNYFLKQNHELFKINNFLKLKNKLRYPKYLIDYHYRNLLESYLNNIRNNELNIGNKIVIYDLLDKYTFLFDFLIKYDFPLNKYLFNLFYNQNFEINIKSIFNISMAKNKTILNDNKINNKNINILVIIPLIEKYLSKFNTNLNCKNLEEIFLNFDEKLIYYYDKNNYEFLNYNINNTELLLGLEKIENDEFTKNENNSINDDNDLILYLHFNENRKYLKNYLDEKNIFISYLNYNFEELDEEDPLEFKDNWGQNCQPIYSLNCEKNGYIKIDKENLNWDNINILTIEFYLKTFEVEKMIILSMGNNLLNLIYKDKCLKFIYNKKEIGKVDFINFNNNWHFYSIIIKKDELKFYLINDYEYINNDINLNNVFNNDFYLFFNSKFNLTELRIWKIERDKNELEEYSNYPLSIIFLDQNKLNIEMEIKSNKNNEFDNNNDFSNYNINYNEDNNDFDFENINLINNENSLRNDSFNKSFIKSFSSCDLKQKNKCFDKLISELPLLTITKKINLNSFNDKIFADFENLLMVNRRLLIKDKYNDMLENLDKFLNIIYWKFDKNMNSNNFIIIIKSIINYKILISFLNKIKKLDYKKNEETIILLLFILINLFIKIEDRFIIILLSININIILKNDRFANKLFKTLKKLNYKYSNNKEKEFFENKRKKLNLKNNIYIQIWCPNCNETLKFKGKYNCNKCFKIFKFCFKNWNFFKNNLIKECLLCKVTQEKYSILGKNCNFCLIGNF